jgi:hypothetical protein
MHRPSLPHGVSAASGPDRVTASVVRPWHIVTGGGRPPRHRSGGFSGTRGQALRNRRRRVKPSWGRRLWMVPLAGLTVADRGFGLVAVPVGPDLARQHRPDRGVRQPRPGHDLSPPGTGASPITRDLRAANGRAGSTRRGIAKGPGATAGDGIPRPRTSRRLGQSGGGPDRPRYGIRPGLLRRRQEGHRHQCQGSGIYLERMHPRPALWGSRTRLESGAMNHPSTTDLLFSSRRACLR